MNRSVFPIRTVSVAGLVVLLALLHTRPAQGLTLSQITPEPPPRPTATPAPCIEVDPTQAVGQQDVELLVTGYCWPAGLPGVTLFFDVADSVHRLAGPFPADAAGSFQRVVIVPAAWASPGLHAVIACSSGGSCASATIELLAPTPTITPTPTDTLTPTATRTPTDTPTPITPSPTATTTNTPTPSSTMRPVTPIVTGTTTPRATSQPPSAATSTTAPIPPAVPTATATSRPVIIASSTSTFTPSPTSTPTSTDTPTPTSTDTPTPTSTDTPTPTPTSTSTPTPTSTPRPSLPVAASLATSSVPPSTAANLPDTGRDWVATFLTGFIAAILLIALLTAFMVVVFASLLVAWRILRMRQLEGQR